MKNILLTIFVSAMILNCNAQTNCSIKKAYAFYSISTPGVQMADDNGNPIPVKSTINRFIYIEWTGAKNPEIETVMYNNKALTANLSAVEGDTAVLGPNFINNPDFKVISKKCNKLWKIDLGNVLGNEAPEQNCNNIIIKTKGSKNACVFKLTKETLLMTMPRY